MSLIKIIIGYSGHAYVVLETLLHNKIYLDNYVSLNLNKKNPFNLEYLGSDLKFILENSKVNKQFILGIGDNSIREQYANLILTFEEKIINVIHPNASISSTVNLGCGIFISNGAIINVFSKIEDFVIINTGAIIEHECTIRKSAHIAPGVVLAGNVTIGERAFIGANSVIKQGVSIGNDSIVGAGSVVLKDIPNNSIIVGNPTKFIK